MEGNITAGQNFLREVGVVRLPVLIQEKERQTCYILGKDGYLRQFQKAGNGWKLLSPDLGKDTVQGFEALTDNLGRHLLITCNREGAFFLLQPEADKAAPEPFFRATATEIIQFSACLDRQNILHLLHLSANRKNERSSLIYHRYEQGEWGDGIAFDLGSCPMEQSSFILLALDDSLLVIYCLNENGTSRPVLRRLEKEHATLGKIIYLPENWGNPLLPSAGITADHTLHLSWITFRDEVVSLNYACTDDGGWRNLLTMDISAFSLPLAPLYVQGNRLLLAWKNHNMLFHLLSDDGGANWKFLRSRPLGQLPRLIRFRTVPHTEHQNEKWRGNYLFVYGLPPAYLLEPEQLIRHGEEESPFEREFQNLGRLYSSLAARAGQIEKVNAALQNKLVKREEEYLELYSRSNSRIKELEGQLMSKNIELQKVETAFKSTLKELQGLIKEEKKSLQEKQHQQSLELDRLKNEVKTLREKSIRQEQNIKQLEEKNLLLKQENEELQKKQGPFLLRFFKGYQPKQHNKNKKG